MRPVDKMFKVQKCSFLIHIYPEHNLYIKIVFRSQFILLKQSIQDHKYINLELEADDKIVRTIHLKGP